jgi:CBS domain-containing protein
MNVEHDLHNEQIYHLDLSEFTLVESGTSIQDVIDKMVSEKHNCAFITKDKGLVGIFTDRDVLRRVVDHPEIWDHPIDEVMTHNPKSIQANQPAGDALKIMNELHFRNTPVLNEEKKIIGNMTHFAIIRYLADHFPAEVYNLPPNPGNYGGERHGG